MIYVYIYAYLFFTCFMYGWVHSTTDCWKLWKAIWWPVTLPYVLGRVVPVLVIRWKG